LREGQDNQATPSSGTTAPDRRWWRTPPALTYCFLGFVALAYWLLGIGQGESDIAKSVEWLTWKLLAALAIGIALASGVLGVSALQKVRGDSFASGGKSQSSAADRLAEPLRQETRGKLVKYGIAASILAGALTAFFATGGRRGSKGWPDSLDIGLRPVWVILSVGLAAVPWLVLVWLLQERLTGYAKGKTSATTQELIHLWDLLYSIILVFAVFVVLTLVTTGALRAAYFAGDKDPAANKQGPEFSSSSVLLYGAFLALLLSAIALPMVAAYRRAAQRCLQDWHPMEEPPNKDEKDAVEWHETLLHLDIGVIRSPITALTIFTPLVSAALAAFLPDLAS
jgi:hypothetical protein